MDENSLKAIHFLREHKIIGDRQSEVLSIIQNSKVPLTDSEIMKELLEEDPNYVRPRRRELVKLGILESKSSRVCSITNQTANAWGMRDFTIEEVTINHANQKAKSDIMKEYEKLKVKLYLAEKTIEKQKERIIELENKIEDISNDIRIEQEIRE